MLVGELLELDGDSRLLDQARQRWSSWTAADPRLAPVPSFDELRDWTKASEPATVDAALLALAERAASDGGDDIAAAAVLAYCLLPGASLLACELATQLTNRSDDINQMVAAQLWIEVRSFPWQRLARVAGNVIANTRIGVLQQAGHRPTLFRYDRTWANTFPSETVGLASDGEGSVDPTTELLEVLGWACDEEVITEDDRALLLHLVDEAEQHEETRRYTLGNGGLTAEGIAGGVARHLGVSPVTVRRRCARTIRAISLAIPEGQFS